MVSNGQTIRLSSWNWLTIVGVIIVQTVSMLGTALIWKGSIESRVTAIENKDEFRKESLGRIERKLDGIAEQLDQFKQRVVRMEGRPNGS